MKQEAGPLYDKATAAPDPHKNLWALRMAQTSQQARQPGHPATKCKSNKVCLATKQEAAPANKKAGSIFAPGFLHDRSNHQNL